MNGVIHNKYDLIEENFDEGESGVRKWSLSYKKRKVDIKISTILVGVLWIFIFTGMGLTYSLNNKVEREIEEIQKRNRSLLINLNDFEKSLSWLETELERNPYKGLLEIVATAYNSEVRQTDSSPFITASGERVKDGTLALSRDMIKAENELMQRMGYNPAATISYGDTVDLIYVKRMIVHDTMAKRFTNRADIWMNSKSNAWEWGIRKVYIIPVGLN